MPKTTAAAMASMGSSEGMRALVRADTPRVVARNSTVDATHAGRRLARRCGRARPGRGRPGRAAPPPPAPPRRPASRRRRLARDAIGGQRDQAERAGRLADHRVQREQARPVRPLDLAVQQPGVHRVGRAVHGVAEQEGGDHADRPGEQRHARPPSGPAGCAARSRSTARRSGGPAAGSAPRRRPRPARPPTPTGPISADARSGSPTTSASRTGIRSRTHHAEAPEQLDGDQRRDAPGSGAAAAARRRSPPAPRGPRRPARRRPRAGRCSVISSATATSDTICRTEGRRHRQGQRRDRADRAERDQSAG